MNLDSRRSAAGMTLLSMSLPDVETQDFASLRGCRGHHDAVHDSGRACWMKRRSAGCPAVRREDAAGARSSRLSRLCRLQYAVHEFGRPSGSAAGMTPAVNVAVQCRDARFCVSTRLRQRYARFVIVGDRPPARSLELQAARRYRCLMLLTQDLVRHGPCCRRSVCVATRSSTAVTLTLCGRFQLAAVNVSCAGTGATCPPPSRVTVTALRGCELSTAL